MDPGNRELEQLVQLGAIERTVLTRPLHFHELSRAAHHHIHVYFGPHILLVVEVEPHFSVDDAHAHRGHTALDRRCGELPCLHHPVERIYDCNRCTGDRGGASSTVGNQDVAIELHRELTELEIVEHGTDAPPDQTLNFLSASAKLCPLTRRARPSRPWKHRVLGSEPPLATSALPARNAVLDRGGAQHACRAERYEARALGVWCDCTLECDRSEIR